MGGGTTSVVPQVRKMSAALAAEGIDFRFSHRLFEPGGSDL